MYNRSLVKDTPKNSTAWKTTRSTCKLSQTKSRKTVRSG